jgi:hypothetical protein
VSEVFKDELVVVEEPAIVDVLVVDTEEEIVVLTEAICELTNVSSAVPEREL